MKSRLSLVLALCLVVNMLFVLPAGVTAADGEGEPETPELPTPVYAENFENGLGEFALRFPGSNSALTSDAARSGDHSLQVGTSFSAQGHWYIHDEQLEQWSVTAWVYDDMSNATSLIHLQDTDTSTRNLDMWVGYNITTTADEQYVTRYMGTHVPTGIARSEGWHEITLVNDYNGTGLVKVYIDGEYATSHVAFKLRTVTIGNFWSERNTSSGRYWDDFALYDTLLEMDDEAEEEEPPPEREPIEGKTTLAFKPAFDIEALNAATVIRLGSADAYVNNIQSMLDPGDPQIAPVRRGTEILVPAEFLADSYGAELTWDETARQLDFLYDGGTAELVIGSATMQWGGAAVPVATPAEVIDHRIYVPLRDIATHVLELTVMEEDYDLVLIAEDPPQLELSQLQTVADKLSVPGLLLFVATDGNDGNAGTLEQPLRTLEGARDRIRALRAGSGVPAGGVAVYVRGGDYARQTPFVLEEQDSGSAAAPIKYAGYPGETARLHGGVIIPSASFAPVTDPVVLSRLSDDASAQVLVADLAALGVTSNQLGSITYQGHGIEIQPSESELVINNHPQRLARYPNYSDLVIREVIREGSVPRAGDNGNIAPIIQYLDDKNRAAQWAGVEDVWIYGFPRWQWADNTIGVKDIDADTKTMELAQPSLYGVIQGQGFYFFNVLEELDVPGEWYLDKNELKAYVYPSEDITDAEIAVTLSGDELIDLQDVSHVTIEHMNMGYVRGNAINISGGSHVGIVGNTIHNAGERAIEAADNPVADEYDINSTNRGGYHYTIMSNEIYNIGKGAIYLSGGDRNTLTDGHMLVINNHIRNYARLRMEDAVKIYGVGNRVAHNKIHDAPKKAIQFGGNDIIVEYNEIYDVLQSVDDMGAVYMGRDLTYQGNMVRHNFFHHLIGPEHLGVGVHAVYFDDFSSGGTIYGNMIYKVHNPIKYNGGSRHHAYNNIIYAANPNSGWYADINNFSQSGDFADPNNQIGINFRRTPYESPAWQQRYPFLADFIASNPRNPRDNLFERNVIAQHKPIGRLLPEYGNQVLNSLETNDDLGFADESSLDFRLDEDSIVFDAIPDFEPLQLELMGLYEDLYHTDRVYRPVIIAANTVDENDGTGSGGAGSGYAGSGTPEERDAVTAESAPDAAGRIVARVTVDDAALRRLIAVNSDLSEVSVRVAKSAVDAVWLSADTLDLLRRHRLELAVQVGRLQFKLPSAALAAAGQQLEGHGALTGEQGLMLQLGVATGSERDRVLAAAERAGYLPVESLLQLKTALYSDGGAEELSGWRLEGLRLRIAMDELAAVDNRALLGIYRYDPDSDAWRYVTSGRSADAGELTYLYDGKGIYGVLEYRRAFADLEGHWAANAMLQLAARAVLQGYPDGTMQPDKTVSRAEYVSLLLRLFGWSAGGAGQGQVQETGFGDVSADAWYAGAVDAAVQLGIAAGYGDGTFRPHAPINRAEMAAMTVRAAQAAGVLGDRSAMETGAALDDFADAASVPEWSKEAFTTVIHAGWMTGTEDRFIGADTAASRAQAATAVERMLRDAERESGQDERR